MKFPLQRVAADIKNQKPNFPPPFIFPDAPEASKDSIVRTGFNRRRVMLLSDGCEIDKVLKERADPTRPFLVAPVEDLLKSKLDGQQITNVRQGVQDNKFGIPECANTEGRELYVDLRRITPIPAAYLLERRDKRMFSLSIPAQDDLREKLLHFFCGIALVTEVSCPACGEHIEMKDFLAPHLASHDEPVED